MSDVAEWYYTRQSKDTRDRLRDRELEAAVAARSMGDAGAAAGGAGMDDDFDPVQDFWIAVALVAGTSCVCLSLWLLSQP